jgi:hypothetical protein
MYYTYVMENQRMRQDQALSTDSHSKSVEETGKLSRYHLYLSLKLFFLAGLSSEQLKSVVNRRKETGIEAPPAWWPKFEPKQLDKKEPSTVYPNRLSNAQPTSPVLTPDEYGD